MLVGITGKSGVGKDTAADALVRNHGYVKYSLAEPLKAALNAMFGWSPDLWNDRGWKEGTIPSIGASPRRLAQTLGTEWGRSIINPDLWIGIAAKKFQKVGSYKMVIPDVRFDNEAEWIIQEGGIVIDLTRPGTAAVEAHSSEDGLTADLITHSVENSGSINLLHAHMADVVGA
tara:strand:- start:13884 stop:14405 length:522 start_codon:yes stop_codon:yes gene_type:complete